MGFIPSLLGIGKATGANFDAQGTNIQQPATVDQANQLYGQAQSGIGQQQQFANALAAQGGIGNQSNVFNQQQQLANQLGQQAQGEGPNPALAQLANTTGQNVAQQAALMAGQRGAGANAGLMARQIGQQGAATQQNAAGQAAVLKAQQQLAAQQQLQQQQNMMAGLSTQQIGQQAQGIQGLNQATQGLQGNILGAIGAQNNANVGMQSNINSANAGVQQQVAKSQGDMAKSIFDSAGKGMGMLAMADGGEIPGNSAPVAPPLAEEKEEGGGMPPFAMLALLAQGGQIPIPSVMHYRTEGQHTAGKYAEGGPVSYVGQMVHKARGGAINGERYAHSKTKVPGKASHPGDTTKNDTVPAMLSPGEIIIPRSAASDPGKAAAFAKSVAMKSKRKK